MRKKKNELLTQSQKDVMEIISKTGCLPKDNIKGFGIRNRTISSLIEFGYIKKEEMIVDRNTTREIYTADDKGSKYLNNYYGYHNMYKHQSLIHDSELNDSFLKNDYWNKYQNNEISILSEIQCKDLLIEKINNIEDYETRNHYLEELREHHISPVDMLIVNEQNGSISYEYIEVITVNYNQEMIKAKELCIEILNNY